MEKSNFDFSQPTRQSIFAILMILWKTIRVIFAQLFPIVLVFLFGNTKNKPALLVIALVIMAILAMVISIIKYFKTFFYVTGQELIVHKGIFNKIKTTIPFDKIQSISFDQNVLQQVFEVTQLKVETAGSDKTELVFHAISNENAQALRDYIFSHKKETKDAVPDSTNDVVPSYETIMTLDITRLLKVGVTENHIKSFWVILIFFYWIISNLKEAGIDIDGYSQEVDASNWSKNILITIAIILIITSVVISLARIVFSYFDLHFLRSQNGFKIIRGLFNRKEISVPDQKIQIISWRDNQLKMLIGFKDLYLSQASSSQLSTNQLIKIPGCSDTHIRQVVQAVLGSANIEDISLTRVDDKYFKRFVVIIASITSILTILLIIANDLMTIPFLWAFVIYITFVRYLSFRKKYYGYDENTLYIQGGKWGHKANLLSIYKLQGIKIKQSPYQRRHQLCSLILFTASGNVSIPYIPLVKGQKMADDFIFTIESTKKNWM
jgi:putative membrane protein